MDLPISSFLIVFSNYNFISPVSRGARGQNAPQRLLTGKREARKKGKMEQERRKNEKGKVKNGRRKSYKMRRGFFFFFFFFFFNEWCIFVIFTKFGKDMMEKLWEKGVMRVYFHTWKIHVCFESPFTRMISTPKYKCPPPDVHYTITHKLQ